jgi:hypothetical protein
MHRNGMPDVLMSITGTGVGASGEREGFEQMVRAGIAGVAPRARVDVDVGADDAVRIEVTVARSLQLEVGTVLEHLLWPAAIRSRVIGEDDGEE